MAVNPFPDFFARRFLCFSSRFFYDFSYLSRASH